MPAKELQITWNVGDNDLMYRLNKAIRHLSKGGRMNIILGARKVKLVRTRHQREEMLAKIRETLAPCATEWREMTGGFPNAELWFQGIASKNNTGKESGMEDEDMEEEDEEEEEDDNEEEEVDADEVKEEVEEGEDTAEADTDESKLDPLDPTKISWEEFQANRAKFKGKANRKALRAEAEKAFEKTTATTGTTINSDEYWKQLVNTSTANTPPAKLSTPPPTDSKKSNKTPKQTKVDQEEALKAAEQARLAELSGRVGSRKEVERAQIKIQSVAAQFSKLGASKSMFGSKIGRK
jgi:hypothetical protein